MPTTKKRATKPKRAAAKKPAMPPLPPVGSVTHTELASQDPAATKAWCKTVLGWKFGPDMPTPGGPYAVASLGKSSGAGIRANEPSEQAGVIPYIAVASIRSSFEKALKAGADEVMAPEEIPGGMGWMALVRAPGGVPIGLWSMK